MIKQKKISHYHWKGLSEMVSPICVGCGACANICPKKCITMSYLSKGWYRPVICKDLCIECNACKDVCPVLNGYKPNKKMKKAAFFINKDEYFRGLSSSGGFFHALASLIFKENGVVFGAYLDKDFVVRHGFCEKEDELFPFLTSKYVQSNTNTSYTQVKKFLNDGRKVLYTGTPCNIAGLSSFLGGRQPKNLLTCELFCHGVPSPYSWSAYLNEYYKLDEIRYILFRCKDAGWWKCGLRIQFLHNDYYTPMREMHDDYMRAFLKDINLNEACYNCKFKCDCKNADFTIGDGWNVNRVRSNMDDNKGITTVLINSKLGEDYFEMLKKHHCYEISIDDALFVRTELVATKEVPKIRDKFMNDLLNNGFKYAINSNNI